MLGTLMSNQSDVIEQMDSEIQKVVAAKFAHHDLSCTHNYALLISRTIH